jgi:predicted tellurium resistance membrane protein TerC
MLFLMLAPSFLLPLLCSFISVRICCLYFYFFLAVSLFLFDFSRLQITFPKCLADKTRIYQVIWNLSLFLEETIQEK